MSDFLKFLAEYEILIYIVLAIGALFSFRWLYRSWREWQVAVFSLEREFSARRFGRSALISAMIVVFFCVEFFMASFIIPGLPADFFLATPTGTLSPELMTQFANQPQVAQPNAAGCTPGQVELTFPEAGDEIKGIIELTGTVDIPNFGFYKYEVAPNGSDTWATIAAGRVVVKSGPLGRWDTTALTPGDYQLRLVVIDNQGTSLTPCVVPVQVVPNQ
jgi:hypothetical protein